MIELYCSLCNSDDGILSLHQVLFNSFPFFQRYDPDDLDIAKIRKGSNSVNSGDRVMVFAFCDFPHGPLIVYLISFKFLSIISNNILDGWMVGCFGA